MARAQVWKGEMTGRAVPDWRPLCAVAGEAVVADFMWMFEVELSDHAVLQAYKHIDTRRYIHLDPNGLAYAYEAPGRYRSVPTADALADACRSPLINQRL